MCLLGLGDGIAVGRHESLVHPGLQFIGNGNVFLIDSLDQPVDIVGQGDLPMLRLLKQTPRAQQDGLCINRLPPQGAPEILRLIPGQPGDQQHRAGNRALRPGMAPQPAGPLQQEIDGREVGGDDVEIEIQALLSHLGGNQDLAATAQLATGFTENIERPLFADSAFTSRKTRMEQINLGAVVKPLADLLTLPPQRDAFRKQPVQLLSPLHRVEQREAHSTVGQLQQQRRLHVWQGRTYGLDIEAQAPGRIGLEVGLSDATAGKSRQPRVRGLDPGEVAIDDFGQFAPNGGWQGG